MSAKLDKTQNGERQTTEQNGEGKKEESSSTHDGRRRGRFYLISYPRTASNLLMKILAMEAQSDFFTPKFGGGYYFIPSMLLSYKLHNRAKSVDHWTQDEKDQMKCCFRTCFDEFQDHVRTAEEQGKSMLVKEHSCFMIEPVALSRWLFGSHSVLEPVWTAQARGLETSHHSPKNETIMPDEFLKTFLPTFLIRHPALSFPSSYRMILDLQGPELFQAENEMLELRLYSTLHWTRTLYEWYTEQEDLRQKDHGSHGDGDGDGDGDSDVTWPLILDADDIINSPDTVIRFAEIVGLDPAKLRFDWAPATQDELAQMPNEMYVKCRTTLVASAGVIKSKASTSVDIEAEASKWREEWGDVKGGMMERMVRDAMPDYEWMRERRLRPRRLGLN